MSEDATTRWALPWLHAGQAQKEITHNEALSAIDALLHPAVVGSGERLPPAVLREGESHLVGTTPGGDWAGHAGALATWTANGWRFAAPREGMAVWDIAAASELRFRNGEWRRGVVSASEGIEVAGQRVLGPQQPAVADPAGGGAVDVEARAALAALLQALRTHGLIAPA